MSVQFRKDVTMTIQMSDLAAIITEQVCTFNALSGLRVIGIDQRIDGFELRLEPKDKPRPPTAKEAKP